MLRGVFAMSFEQRNRVNTDNSQLIQMPERMSQNQENPAPMNEENPSYFSSFGGIVREISIRKENNNYWNYILVENKDSTFANLVVTPDTYFVYNTMVSVGSDITGYFPANAPVPMIYLPQYRAMVLVVEPLWQIIKVDFFDENLVSMDGTLKLNIGDHTEVVNQDGTPYEGGLENQLLVVYYGFSTRSIPSIAIPLRVVVLKNNPNNI